MRRTEEAQRKRQVVLPRLGRDAGGFSVTSLERQDARPCRQNDFCSHWVRSVGEADAEFTCRSIDALSDKWQIFTVKSFKTVHSIPASLQKD